MSTPTTWHEWVVQVNETGENANLLVEWMRVALMDARTLALFLDHLGIPAPAASPLPPIRRRGRAAWITPLKDGAHDYTPLLTGRCPNHPDTAVVIKNRNPAILFCLSTLGERYELSADSRSVRVIYPGES